MEEILSEDFVLDQTSPSDDLKQLLRDADIKVLTGCWGDFNINQNTFKTSKQEI